MRVRRLIFIDYDSLWVVIYLKIYLNQGYQPVFQIHYRSFRSLTIGILLLRINILREGPQRASTLYGLSMKMDRHLRINLCLSGKTYIFFPPKLALFGKVNSKITLFFQVDQPVNVIHGYDHSTHAWHSRVGANSFFS